MIFHPQNPCVLLGSGAGALFPLCARRAGGCDRFPALCPDAFLREQGLALPAWKQGRGAPRTAAAKSSKQTERPGAAALTNSPGRGGTVASPGASTGVETLGTCGQRAWDGFSPSSQGGQTWQEAVGGFGEGTFPLVRKPGVPFGTWVAGAGRRKVLAPLRGGGTSKPAARLFFLT